MRPNNDNVTIAMITRLPLIAPMRFSIFRRLITSSKSLLSLGNRASRSFLARSTAAADDVVVLDGTHIDEFIKTRGIVTISAESVAEVAAAGEASVKRDACPLKCLLFLASGSPILVVLRLEDRVSESALASFLGIAKSRLEMARPQQLIPLTGFPVGQVPPFGHREPLYTLIDQCVTNHSHVVFGDNLEYVLSTTELLRAANGKVVSVSLDAAAAAAATGNAEEGGDQNKATTLPVPWVSGSQAVSLTGIIAQKRMIANLLLFLGIIPPTSSSSMRESRPPPATSTYVRRVWAHPETSEPCEVQLILGKTLERRLGRAPAAELFKSLKRGQIVRVTGKPQEHQQQQGQAPRPYVVDMVVHDIEITGTIAPALYSRTDLVENDEEDEEHFGESEEQERERLKKEKKSQPFNKAEQALLDAELPYYKLPVVAENVKLVNDLASIEYMAEILLRGDHHQHAHQIAEVASVGSGGGNAEEEVIEKKEEEDTTVLPTASSMPVLSAKHRVKAARRQAALDPGTWRPRLILGLDAEWQPNFSREEKNSPVSVLQIGSTTHVFLIDMLQLCHNPREESSPHDGGKTEGKTALTLEQKALSDVLEAVLGDADIVKVGFGLKYDFKRLVESYPWMPCFAAAAAEDSDGEENKNEEGIAKSLPYRSVPIRSHVDALLLARSAGDGQTSYKRLGLSAVCRLILGKAVDKSEQTSDWGTRPLTQDQIYYAAADVTCLVDIFNGIIARRPDFLAAFWMAQFSSHLTDMAALRPKLSYLRRGRGGNEGAGGASGAGLSRRTNANARGYGSTNQVQCNVEALMRYLGQPIPDGGKLSIIKLAASETVQTGGGVTRETILVEPSRVPRFTRGSGLLEFENRTYLLFVNVPSQKYPNVFSFSSEDDGNGEQSCYMTWWPGKGQTMAHPMIQRLLPTAAAAAAGAAAEEEEKEEEAGGVLKATEGSLPTVILFVRPQRDEYSCFGRLEASTVEELDGQLCVSWKLIDYSGIKSSAPFQQVLTLQKT